MSRNKDPAVLLYTSDFLTGTALMNFTQRGMYITLLCLQHQQGHLSQEDIINVCGKLDSKVLSKFEKDSSGLYFNKRMEEEIVKRIDFCRVRQVNGSKGGRPRNEEKPIGYPVAKPTGKPTKNLPENENINNTKNSTMYIHSTTTTTNDKPLTSVCVSSAHTHTPTREEVEEYFKEQGYTFAERFYCYYQSTAWEGVEDWKSRAALWKLDDDRKAKESEKSRYGSFNADEAFNAALERSYKD